MNLLSDECTNLRVINFTHSALSKRYLEVIKPIFKKLIEFEVTVCSIDDEDLTNFFVENKSLQKLNISIQNSKIRGTFLNSIPRQTSVHLELNFLNVRIFKMKSLSSLPYLKNLSFRLQRNNTRRIQSFKEFTKIKEHLLE